MKIFVIAGEASGDQLAAAVIVSLKTRIPDAEIRGIGGDAMMHAGLSHSLFPMEELSVMGIAEILPEIPHFLRRISQTVNAIKGFNPDVVLSVDAPEFSFRVQEKLAKTSCAAKRVHLVAPSVWAWRPGRARKIAAFLDAILCLYPFEPQYFAAEGLRAEFIGHTMMSSGLLAGNGPAFRFRHMIGMDRKILGLFFGSRDSEITRNAELLLQSAQVLQQHIPDLFMIVPTLPRLHDRLDLLLKKANLSYQIISDQDEKWDAFAACDAAIAVSGTVGLELAVASVPHVMTYRTSGLTWQIMRRLVKTPYAHLANILLDEAIVPEFLQDAARVSDLTPVVESLLTAGPLRDAQQQAFEKVRFMLYPPVAKKPADCGADLLIELTA